MPPLDPAASFRLNLAKAEAVRIEAIADSWKSSKDRANQYISIARDLKKEARKLERQADAFLQDAAAATKKSRKYYQQLYHSMDSPVKLKHEFKLSAGEANRAEEAA